jgi:hypothetical protein
MPTTLGELIQQANQTLGNELPAQQTRPKATIIEDVMQDPNYNGGGAFGEMRKGTVLPDNTWQNQNMLGQRQVSLDSAYKQHRPQDVFSNTLIPPVYAGTAPPLKQYGSQPAIPMNRIKEKFSLNSKQNCIDTLNHIHSCPMCSRYFQCDAKVYHVIIFMLIILFVTILYFVCKEENRLR